MNIEYAYTILYVEDVAKTIQFYSNAFGFQKKLITPEQDYGEVNSGSTTLAFANFELGEANFKESFIKSNPANQALGIEIAFTSTEVEKVMEKAIQHGAILLSNATLKPWGQIVGYLRDINGFIIEICTPIRS